MFLALKLSYERHYLILIFWKYTLVIVGTVDIWRQMQVHD